MAIKMHKYRTHNCGELTSNNVGQDVKLSGWVHRKSDHGNVLFIDLRDHYGITQVVVNPESHLLDITSQIRIESVITIIGKVIARSSDTVNSQLNTGAIEISATALAIESLADILPFQINSDNELPSEELRLRYRYLDLRREKLHNNIILRSELIDYIRQQMKSQGFMEFQTPILTSSSP